MPRTKLNYPQFQNEWWEEIGRVTGASLTVTVTAKKYLKIIADVRPTGGTLNIGIQFNGDTGTNYADRSSNNGGADATGASQAQIFTKTAVDANPQLIVGEILNIATFEKLVTFQSVIRGTAGAANAPDRKEGVGKWANTSVQITSIQVAQVGGTGTIDTNSSLVVLGHD